MMLITTYFFTGLASILFGRKVFWLFVWIVGFIAGLTLSAILLDSITNLAFIISALFGVICAIIVAFAKKMTIFLAGFLGGAYIFYTVATLIGLEGKAISIFIFFLGGFIGSAFLALIFEWGLILISSIIGAILVTQTLLPLFGFLIYNTLVTFSFLAVIGIGFQGLAYQSDKGRRK